MDVPFTIQGFFLHEDVPGGKIAGPAAEKFPPAVSSATVFLRTGDRQSEYLGTRIRRMSIFSAQ